MSTPNSAQNTPKSPKATPNNIETTPKTEDVKSLSSLFSAVSSSVSALRDSVKERKRKEQEELENAKMPSWKHRRRFIYMTFFLGLGMILFGALTYTTDTQVASQLVIGGVALISIIVTAYTGFAAFEDVRLWSQYERITPMRFGEASPEEDIHGEEELRD